MPVEFSTADTFRMPLESMSKVTSICGMPYSTCGSPVRMNDASLLLSLVKGRSPSNTCTSTSSWKSSFVEKVCVRRVGICV